VTTLTEPITRTLEVPGASLTYDVRPGDTAEAPVLLFIGWPMGAAGFGTLAGHFTNRTVVTYDPRGVERSEQVTPGSPVSPDDNADDLHRLVQALDVGPVDLFASSGGAVNGLALVASHPNDVRTLVAHEPPLASMLPDREAAIAATQAVVDTYGRSGWGAGMAHFIALVSHRGPIPGEWAQQPGPDPQMFGMPTGDDGSRNDPMFTLVLRGTPQYELDFDALRAASTRIVLAAGEDEPGTMANRGAYAVADRLGTEVVAFPGGHSGFLGGEYGQVGKPDAFAARLREVLETDA
jgi:pimeloyl-ACP methyl ester carboxylesterase